MNQLPAAERGWDERTTARKEASRHADGVFESLFERSADAIWLYDPQTRLFLDCNRAAVEMMGAQSKEQLLPSRPEDFAPTMQPDGRLSEEKSTEIIGIVEKEKTHRFEWFMRRLDGREITVEVSATAVLI